ncbi:MAG TPA: hypothetical protein VKR58_08880 [Aquella sp.]|nr:hypothetical protein [Aquella sp.]
MKKLTKLIYVVTLLFLVSVCFATKEEDHEFAVLKEEAFDPIVHYLPPSKSYTRLVSLKLNHPPKIGQKTCET